MNSTLPEVERTVFTIGHSNHPLDTVLGLLARHRIDVVVDVRSSPYAGYATHFNREALQHSLAKHGTEYAFLGDAIGGLPASEEFYDESGHVLYDRLARSTGFQDGMKRLIKGAESYRVALLCSEEDPTNCHRRLLIGRVLREQEVRVLHIRGDGAIQTEQEVAQEEEYRRTQGQMEFFDDPEAREWKSTRSVSPRKVPRSFSDF
jgi:uncharacterized protein (DUF488 family)